MESAVGSKSGNIGRLLLYVLLLPANAHSENLGSVWVNKFEQRSINKETLKLAEDCFEFSELKSNLEIYSFT